MSPWLEAFIAKWGFLIAGLTIGTTAKYGLHLTEGKPVTLRMVAIDALLIGFIALISATAVERLGVTGTAATMIVALFSVSSDRVIRLARLRFLRKVDEEMRRLAAEEHGRVRNVVQAESSGQELIDDMIEGRAPDEYTALKRPPKEL